MNLASPAASRSRRLTISAKECPLMVFHTRDDNNVPFQDAVRFVDAAKLAGRQLVFVTTDHGGHYQLMIDEGIPGAIRWLSQSRIIRCTAFFQMTIDQGPAPARSRTRRAIDHRSTRAVE